MAWPIAMAYVKESGPLRVDWTLMAGGNWSANSKELQRERELQLAYLMAVEKGPRMLLVDSLEKPLARWKVSY